MHERAYKKLKVIPLKEEYMVITEGNILLSLLIQQMIYWTERVYDFDKFITEEKARALRGSRDMEVKIEYTHGWIYKKCSELCEEFSMPTSKETTIRDNLKILVDKKILDKRNNPINKLDRINQYRVNLVKLRELLNNEGYELQGYKFAFSNDKELLTNSTKELNNSESEIRSSKPKTPCKAPPSMREEIAVAELFPEKGENPHKIDCFSKSEIRFSDTEIRSSYIYTETTNKEEKESAHARNNFFLSEEWVPGNEILAIVKSKCEPSDEALKVAVDEFKKFYIAKRIEKQNWDRVFQSWCENRRHWGKSYKVKESFTEANPYQSVVIEADPSLKSLEDKVKETLKASVNESTMRGFIELIKFYKLEKNLLVVTVPSRYIREWVIANYLEVLKKVSSMFNNAIENIEVKIRQADMIA